MTSNDDAPAAIDAGLRAYARSFAAPLIPIAVVAVVLVLVV